MSILTIGQKSRMYQATFGSIHNLSPFRSYKDKQQIRNYKEIRQEQYRNELLNQIKQKQYRQDLQKKRIIELQLKHQKQFYQKIKLQSESHLHKSPKANNDNNNQTNKSGNRLPKISKNFNNPFNQKEFRQQVREYSPNYHHKPINNYNFSSQLQPSRERHSRDRYKTQFSSYDFNLHKRSKLGLNPENQQEDYQYQSAYNYQNLVDPILVNNDYAQRKKQLKDSLDRKSHQIYDLLLYSKNLVKKDFKSQSIRITKRLKTQNFYRDMDLIQQNQQIVRHKKAPNRAIHLRNLSNFQNYEYELINNSNSESRVSRFYKLPKISKRNNQIYMEPLSTLTLSNEQDYQQDQQ